MYHLILVTVFWKSMKINDYLCLSEIFISCSKRNKRQHNVLKTRCVLNGLCKHGSICTYKFWDLWPLVVQVRSKKKTKFCAPDFTERISCSPWTYIYFVLSSLQKPTVLCTLIFGTLSEAIRHRFYGLLGLFSFSTMESINKIILFINLLRLTDSCGHCKFVL